MFILHLLFVELSSCGFLAFPIFLVFIDKSGWPAGLAVNLLLQRRTSGKTRTATKAHEGTEKEKTRKRSVGNSFVF